MYVEYIIPLTWQPDVTFMPSQVGTGVGVGSVVLDGIVLDLSPDLIASEVLAFILVQPSKKGINNPINLLNLRVFIICDFFLPSDL